MENKEIIERKMFIKPITHFCSECNARIMFINNFNRHSHKTEKSAEFSEKELDFMLNQARADESKQIKGFINKIEDLLFDNIAKK